MAFVPVPNCAEVVLHFLLDGQDVENTLWFEHNATPFDESSLTLLADGLTTWVGGNLMSLYPAPLVANFMTLTAQDSQTAPGLVRSLNSQAGGLAVAVMPNEVSLAVGFKTLSRGRGARGRNFLVALPVGSVTGNNVDPGIVQDFVDAYGAINGSIGAAEAVHVVAHRFSGFTIVNGKKVSTPLTTGIPFGVTSYVSADNIVDSQRRRGPGRGR